MPLQNLKSRMKKYLSLLVAGLCLVVSVGCNPFISKELRKKNRCNRKLERVIKKCPELLNTDTVLKVVEIEIPKVEIDSFIIYNPDTTWLVEIQNDTIREFVRQKVFESFPFQDTIKHTIDGFTFLFYNDNGNIGYTVLKPKETRSKDVLIPIEVIKPIQLTLFEKFQNHIGKIIFWLVLLVMLFYIIKLAKKLLF